MPADPEASREALAPRPPGEAGVIHMAMHFGSVDLSALYGTRVGTLPVTGPMEFVTLAPGARLLRPCPLRARRDHRARRRRRSEPRGGARARRGRRPRGRSQHRRQRRRGRALRGARPACPSARPCSRSAPARRSTSRPSSAPAPGSGWATRVRIRPAPGSERREAVRSIIEQEARAFERIIARAPEQWSTLFFPIWTDEGEA